MSGGAIIIRRQSQAIRRFRDAGAMSPERARTFDEVGAPRSWIHNTLINRGVLVPVEEGSDRFWLNDEATHRFLRARARRIVIIFIIVAAVVVGAMAIW